MKEIKKIELRTKLDKVAHLFMIVKESYLYAEYFHNPDTAQERAILIDAVYYDHFRFICHILFKNSVIELAKLFGRRDSDKFRLTKFIDGFKEDGHYGDFGINKELINEWKTKFENHKNSIDFIIK